MRIILLAACEAAGVADAGTLRVADGGERLEIATTGVSVVVDKAGQRPRWEVRSLYAAVDLKSSDWREVDEVVDSFPMGGETQAARVAVMLVVQHVVDAAIDAAA